MAIPFELNEEDYANIQVLQLKQFERLLKEMLALLNTTGWTSLPRNRENSAQLNCILGNDQRVRREHALRRQMPDLVASCPVVPPPHENEDIEAAIVDAVATGIAAASMPAPPPHIRMPRYLGPPVNRASSEVRNAAMVRAFNAPAATQRDRILAAMGAAQAADVAADAAVARAVRDANAAEARAASDAPARAASDAAARAASDAAARAASDARARADNAAARDANAAARDANAAAARDANAAAARAASDAAARAANATGVRTVNATAGRQPAGARAISVQVELCADCYHRGSGRKLKVIGVTRVERTTTAAAGHQHHNHAMHVLEDGDDIIQHLRVACRNMAQQTSDNHHIEEHRADLSQPRETAGYGSKVARHLSQTLLNRSTIQSSILTAVFVVVGMKMFNRH